MRGDHLLGLVVAVEHRGGARMLLAPGQGGDRPLNRLADERMNERQRLTRAEQVHRERVGRLGRLARGHLGESGDVTQRGAEVSHDGHRQRHQPNPWGASTPDAPPS